MYQHEQNCWASGLRDDGETNLKKTTERDLEVLRQT